MHWATWAVDLGMLTPAKISATGSKSARALHAAAALPRLYAMLQEQSAGHSSDFMGTLAGCERDIQRLSSVALTYLTRVNPSPALLLSCQLEHHDHGHLLYPHLICEYEIVSACTGPALVPRILTRLTPMPSG